MTVVLKNFVEGAMRLALEERQARLKALLRHQKLDEVCSA